jgi:hypothetical protein
VSDALEQAIALLIDGRPIDWDALLARAGGETERGRLEDLRALTQPASRALPRATFDVGDMNADARCTMTQWGHLRIIDEIGAGAFSVVYRAWDARLDREVALKVLHGDDDRDALEEARRLARVSHRNVVTVYGADRCDGRSGVWMELLKGQTLDTILSLQGPYSAAEAVLIGRELCAALAAVHATGLVHRDIKAQNVMRETGGRIVLMDVGSSLDTSRSHIDVESVTGTPLYMSPELFSGAMASAASDIYSLGVLLYRLVTSQFPIEGRTIGDVRRAHREAKLRPLRQQRPDLPNTFIDVVERCLAADPARRFPNVATLDQALSRVAVQPAPHQAVAPGRWRRAAILAMIALAVAAGVALMRLSRGAAVEPAPAISPEVYPLFAGYEEVGFSLRDAYPAAAARALEAGLTNVRPELPGNQPIHGLLYARIAESWRRAGELGRAQASVLDGAVNVLGTVGEEHPFTAVLALESARLAQATGDHTNAAAELLRALAIRSRVLGLDALRQAKPVMLDAALVARHSRNVSLDMDTDGDGLLDLVEVAAGLDPQAIDSNADGIFDDDEDHDHDGVSNRLALGLVGGAFLTWAHFASREPRTLGWQSPLRFPMVERPLDGAAAWSVSTALTQGYYTQRLSPLHSERALRHGFSVFARVAPLSGVTGITVDTAPAGPRFDLLIRRVDDRTLEARLASSILPREGARVVVPQGAGGRWPLFELRYRPQTKSALAYVDGRAHPSPYLGHQQFQAADEGGIAWGISGLGEGTTAAAHVNLVWLEVF